MTEARLYAILRPHGVGFKTLLSYCDLDTARSFMRANGLEKLTEKHFDDCGLVQWVVA